MISVPIPRWHGIFSTSLSCLFSKIPRRIQKFLLVCLGLGGGGGGGGGRSESPHILSAITLLSPTLQRHDQAVLLVLSLTLLILMVMAPLTDVNPGFLAQLTACCAMGSIFVTGKTLGHLRRCSLMRQSNAGYVTWPEAP